MTTTGVASDAKQRFNRTAGPNAPTSAATARRHRAPQEEKDPPPEKYSIEWYLERARETERSKATPDASRSSGGVVALALLAAASAAALVFL